MTVAQDEILKGACHGLLAGCLLPVLAYNMGAKNTANSVVYLALLVFEIFQIRKHIRRVGVDNLTINL